MKSFKFAFVFLLLVPLFALSGCGAAIELGTQAASTAIYKSASNHAANGGIAANLPALQDCKVLTSGIFDCVTDVYVVVPKTDDDNADYQEVRRLTKIAKSKIHGKYREMPLQTAHIWPSGFMARFKHVRTRYTGTWFEISE